MIKVIGIEWETDGESVDLPSEVVLPDLIVDIGCCDEPLECENNTQSVNDYLSDKYGWLVHNYTLIEDY